MTDLKIYSVTLVFTPPGPLHTSLVIAQDEANASAMAMQQALGNLPIVTPLATVLAIAVDPDVLRQMLRAIEGRGPGDVVSLVPRGPSAATMLAEQRAAEILRKHGPDATPAQTTRTDGGQLLHDLSSREQRAAELLREREPDLDAADVSTFTPRNVNRLLRYREEEYGPPVPEVSTFCGSGVTEAWEQHRAEHPEIYRPYEGPGPAG